MRSSRLRALPPASRSESSLRSSSRPCSARLLPSSAAAAVWLPTAPLGQSSFMHSPSWPLHGLKRQIQIPPPSCTKSLGVNSDHCESGAPSRGRHCPSTTNLLLAFFQNRPSLLYRGQNETSTSRLGFSAAAFESASKRSNCEALLPPPPPHTMSLPGACERSLR
jgi:hypothetical protein